MNISIDTSILWRDRKLEGSDILLLRKLSKLGLIKLHIPWIVYKESTSQNHIEIKATIDRIVKELRTLDKKGLRNREHLKLLKIADQIEEVNFEKSTTEHWNEFIESSKAILHGIEDKHGELVMSSYFAGGKPFPEPKSKKDIPDAFVYQSLVTLTKKYGKIDFICDDNNLRDRCGEIENVTGLKTFVDLYNLPEFIVVKEKYKRIEHYVEELIVLEENIEEIKSKAELDIWNEILNDITISSVNIPDDNNEGRLTDIIEVNSINIDKLRIQFIDNYFYVPVDAEGVFTIEYFIFKADYHGYDERRNIGIIDHDWNDYYFLVEETFQVKFSYKYKIAKDKVNSLEAEVEDINFDEVNIILN